MGRAALVPEPIVVNGESPGFPSALGYRDITVRTRWGPGVAGPPPLLIYCWYFPPITRLSNRACSVFSCLELTFLISRSQVRTPTGSPTDDRLEGRACLCQSGLAALAGIRLLGPLRAQDEALLSHDRARPGDRRIGCNPVHKIIVVTRVVVEDYQRLYRRRIGKTHSFFPA